jgi:hypothetical protein
MFRIFGSYWITKLIFVLLVFSMIAFSIMLIVSAHN